MSLVRAALLPKILFAPGGSYTPKSGISRHDHGRMACSRLPDGGYAFYPDDDRRLRLPSTSFAWMIFDDEPGWEVAPPSHAYKLESVVFRTDIPVPGRVVSLSYWASDRNPDIQAVESERGIELVVPGVGSAIVPWHSVASLLDRRIATPTPIEPIPPADAWPVHEVTPTQPPRRKGR